MQGLLNTVSFRHVIPRSRQRVICQISSYLYFSLRYAWQSSNLFWHVLGNTLWSINIIIIYTAGVKGLRVHFLGLDVRVARGVRAGGISRAYPNTARLMLAYITQAPYFDKRPLRRLARLETILISENQRVRLIEFRLYMEYLIPVLFLPCMQLFL